MLTRPSLGMRAARPRIAGDCDSCDRSDANGYRRPVRTTALLAAAALSATLLAPAPAEAAPARRVSYADWGSQRQLERGTLRGTAVEQGALVVDEPTGSRSYGGRTYETATWTSPWRTPAFEFSELIASWEATTQGGAWIEVSVRGRTATGTRSSWDVLGRWAGWDRFVQRTSVPGQGDDLADVNVDTWRADSTLDGWQLRVTLLRRPGTAGPRVDAVGAMASRRPATDGVATSEPGPGSGVRLAVPRYSQMVHSGHYPRWGGGGQAWCSPTSTSMVLGYYDALPTPKDYAWVPDDHRAPWVDHAARSTYDADYSGTGNWPFNTAYAATRTDRAFVTRLRNLREAGLFIEAGIPLVASVSFGPGELDGAPISSTNGHLLVIVGFTDDGDVVVNDPAARTAKGVRRTYDRGQFEDVWLPTSGGLVYVIADAEHPLPASRGNW